VARAPGRIRFDLCDAVAASGNGPPVPRTLRIHHDLPSGVEGPEVGDVADDGLGRTSVGHYLRLRLRIRPPRGVRNPGGRDEARRLARRGIGATANLVDRRLWVRISEREGGFARLLARFSSGIDSLRQSSAQRLAHSGPGHELIAALVLGDRSALTREQRDAFSRLGLAHLLAVSGLHVSLVAGLAFAGVRWLLLRSSTLAGHVDVRRPAITAALIAACSYGVLAGFGVPIRRALLFLLTAGLALRFGRGFSGIQVLSLAGLTLLVAEPYILFELGAQLSFLASAALLLARGAAFGERAPLVATLTRTSATAIAGTAPALALHGAGAGVIGIATNLVAVPWVGLVLLPSSIVTLLLAWLPLPALALRPGYWISEFTLVSIVQLSQWLPEAPAPHAPAIWAWLLGSALAGLALLTASLPRRLLCVVSMGAVFSASPPSMHGASLPPVPRVVGFDVGLGDSILIQGHSAAVLVDAGRALAPRFDSGRSIVVPALASLGVARLDLVVASHADLDHRGGLPAVIGRIPVAEIWLPVGGRADPDFGVLLAAAGMRGIPVHERGSEDPAVQFGDLVVTPLWPPRDGRLRSRNGGSLVLGVTAGSGWGQRILLPGDLGIAEEQALIDRNPDLRSDILKVGHHGSRGSSSRAFLEAVRPSRVLLSAPCHGRAGLPSRQVVEALGGAGRQLFWTGRDGAVMLGLASGTSSGRGWRPRQGCIAH